MKIWILYPVQISRQDLLKVKYCISFLPFNFKFICSVSLRLCGYLCLFYAFHRRGAEAQRIAVLSEESSLRLCVFAVKDITCFSTARSQCSRCFCPLQEIGPRQTPRLPAAPGGDRQDKNPSFRCWYILPLLERKCRYTSGSTRRWWYW